MILCRGHIFSIPFLTRYLECRGPCLYLHKDLKPINFRLALPLVSETPMNQLYDSQFHLEVFHCLHFPYMDDRLNMLGGPWNWPASHSLFNSRVTPSLTLLHPSVILSINKTALPSYLLPFKLSLDCSLLLSDLVLPFPGRLCFLYKLANIWTWNALRKIKCIPSRFSSLKWRLLPADHSALLFLGSFQA